MIDIETRVVESMRARADAAPPTGNMNERVMSRAAGVRRRRRVLRGMAAAAVVAAAVAALPATPLFNDRGRALDGVATPPTAPAKPLRSPGPTTMPEIAGAPTAGDLPAAIGTDPMMLHFDVYLASVNITASVWTSGPGYEKVTTRYDKEGRFVEAAIGTDLAVLDARRTPVGNAWILPDGSMNPAFTEAPVATLTIGGRPATLFSVTNDPIDRSSRPIGATGLTMSNPEHKLAALVLRWQPVDGVNAVVQTLGYDRSLLEKVAGALRLDRAQRCATPLRFTPPAGGTLTECRTSVRARPAGTAGVWLDSSFRYTMPGGTIASVWTEIKPDRVPHDINQFQATHTINGAKAQWRTADPPGLWLLSYGPAPAEVFISGLGQAESLALVEGMTFGPDLADITTWPAGPTG
jgi:hypothetical protein